MNFFPAKVEGDQLKLPIGDVPLPATPARGGAERRAGDLIAGVRPEHFEDAALARATSRRGTTFEAPIELVESMGSEVYAHFTRARAARRARSSPSWPPTAAPPTSRLRARGSRSRAWSRRRRRPRGRATRWACIPRRSTCSTCGRGATSSSPRAAGTAARRQRSSHPPRSRPLRSRTRRRMRLPRPRRRRRRRSRPRRRLSPRTSLGRRHHAPVVALGADAQVRVGLGAVADLIRPRAASRTSGAYSVSNHSRAAVSRSSSSPRSCTGAERPRLHGLRQVAVAHGSLSLIRARVLAPGAARARGRRARGSCAEGR